MTGTTNSYMYFKIFFFILDFGLVKMIKISNSFKMDSLWLVFQKTFYFCLILPAFIRLLMYNTLISL